MTKSDAFTKIYNFQCPLYVCVICGAYPVKSVGDAEVFVFCFSEKMVGKNFKLFDAVKATQNFAERQELIFAIRVSGN